MVEFDKKKPKLKKERMRIYQSVPKEGGDSFIYTISRLNPGMSSSIQFFEIGQDISMDPNHLNVIIHFPDMVFIQTTDPGIVFPNGAQTYIPLSLQERQENTTYACIGHISSREAQQNIDHKQTLNPLFVRDVWDHSEGALSTWLYLSGSHYKYGSQVPCLLILSFPPPDPRMVSIRVLNSLTPSQMERFVRTVPVIEVITVPKRKSYVEDFLITHKIDHATIFPAVQPEKCKKMLTKGETGCFLSHLAVFEKHKHDPAGSSVLILEDDVQVSNKIQNIWVGDYIMEILRNIPKTWEIFYLGYCVDHCRYHELDPTRSFVKVYRPYCSHAYLIKTDTIRKILSTNPSVSTPYDIFLSSFIRKHKIETYAPYPMNVFEQNPNLQSTIQNPWGSALRKHIVVPACIETIYTPSNFIWVVLVVFLVMSLILMFYASI